MELRLNRGSDVTRVLVRATSAVTVGVLTWTEIFKGDDFPTA